MSLAEIANKDPSTPRGCARRCRSRSSALVDRPRALVDELEVCRRASRKQSPVQDRSSPTVWIHSPSANDALLCKAATRAACA